MRHWALKHIKAIEGPLAIARSCKVCGFHVTAKKLPKGMAGRGWGLQAGNKLIGEVIQHIKAAHPELKEANP